LYTEVPWRLIRSLSRKKERDKSHLTVAEGPSVVLSALRARVEMHAVILTRDFADSERSLAIREAMKQQPGTCRLFTVSMDLYTRMSGTRTPQGAMCLVTIPFRFLEGEPEAAWKEPLYVIGVDIQDPGNVGTLIRNGASAGASNIIFCGYSADPFSPKVIRASAGAIFRSRVSFREDPVNVLQECHQSRISVYKAIPRGGIPPWEGNFRFPCAVVLGNEGQGLSPEVLALTGLGITIPMPGGTESLNVAMACSILLYEAVRQRMKAGDI
jgi:TrmH family RNA methyltransferase